MTEQEQIEDRHEIASIINGCLREGYCTASQLARRITQAGYRKIDDSCEVITKDDLNLYKKQAVKEFATLVKRECTYTNNHGLDLIRVVDFDVFLKEYEAEE